MPPKDVMPNLFGESKIYIGKDLCDVEGLRDYTSKQVFKITKDAITIKEELPTPESINTTGTVTLTFKPLFDYRELRRQLLLLMGFKIGKPRKTTYKTLRHDCAKRNGRV